jgi:hypothetical protein
MTDDPEGGTVPRDETDRRQVDAYEAPMLVRLGSVHDLTLGCDKTTGGSDGFTFQSVPIHCTSA